MAIFAVTDLFCTVLRVKWRPVKNRKHFEGGGIAPEALVTADGIAFLPAFPRSSGALMSRAQTYSTLKGDCSYMGL